MTLVPIMWTIWGLLTASMLGLHIYRTSLEKDEDDQLFLDESFAHEQAAQAGIVARVNKIEPVLKVAKWLVAAMSAVVVAYYVRDILLKLDVLG